MTLKDQQGQRAENVWKRTWRGSRGRSKEAFFRVTVSHRRGLSSIVPLSDLFFKIMVTIKCKEVASKWAKFKVEEENIKFVFFSSFKIYL